MKQLHHPDSKDIQLASVLYALSDPVRLYVVSEIRKHGEQACNSFKVPIAKSTLTHHSRTLREAGVINTRAQGTQRILSLRTEDLDERFPGLLDSILQAYENSGQAEGFGEQGELAEEQG